MTGPHTPARVHGGPGAQGPVRWDFSTNAHAAGPCPAALQSVQLADPCRYPDPGCDALRERLANWHGVAPQRIVLAASASEFIQRITAVSSRLWPGAVAVPALAYGDYAAAAHAGAPTRAAQSASPIRRRPTPQRFSPCSTACTHRCACKAVSPGHGLAWTRCSSSTAPTRPWA
jgi:histidinol-phosphate/aromatic aminotransferase/cobyric acid decarboxylase-like protein